jgi:transcriptional regulator with XRE-family HTH domain
VSAQHTASDGRLTVGDLLRYWRGVRGASQLALASEAMTTPRYVSFIETGRSQPSRQMVVRLARALDVPLRERNALLVAAGYAPLYTEAPLDGPELDRVGAALGALLDQHEPFPAVVMDRGWDVLRANAGAVRLFGSLLAPASLPAPANVLRLIIEPGPVRDAVANWDEVVPALLDRARREAVGGVLDPTTAALVAGLRSRPDVARLLAAPGTSGPSAPVVDVAIHWGADLLRFFSLVTTVGTPVDVTAQELRLEVFVPSDDATRAAWRPPGNGPPPSSMGA